MSPPSRGPWIVAGVLLIAAAIAAYIVFSFRAREQTTTAPAPTPAPATESIQPLGGNAPSIVLPPLDESDALVADLVRKLSSHPRVVAWLTTDGLVRNFAVVVLNIAEGKAPGALLRPLRPSSGFRVVERNGELYVDSRSYERYTGLAEAVASIDPKQSAVLYATLKPRIEEAHRELGELDASFDRTLERAIVLLLKTPVPDGPVRVEPHGIGYGFANPKMETMTAAQKQLLRTGSQNARAIQSKLREIALALGIPAERLP